MALKDNKKYERALSLALGDNPDWEKIVRLLEESVSEGCPQAAYALATWYLHGEHVEKDVSRAIMLLKRAADKNVPEACYDLAVCFEEPHGVSMDARRAFHLYVKAALYGDAQSYHEVGRCYYYGIGIDEDRELSEIWLEKAESIGVEQD